jgi:hypothetical protein
MSNPAPRFVIKKEPTKKVTPALVQKQEVVADNAVRSYVPQDHHRVVLSRRDHSGERVVHPLDGFKVCKLREEQLTQNEKAEVQKFMEVYIMGKAIENGTTIWLTLKQLYNEMVPDVSFVILHKICNYENWEKLRLEFRRISFQEHANLMVEYVAEKRFTFDKEMIETAELGMSIVRNKMVEQHENLRASDLDRLSSSLSKFQDIGLTAMENAKILHNEEIKAVSQARSLEDLSVEELEAIYEVLN